MTPEATQQPITAKTREQEKTELERAQDIAYTINHAVVCTAADLFGAPVNAMLQRYWPEARITCTHEGHGHGSSHAGHGHAAEKRTFANIMAHVGSAEFLADIFAVPLTIGVQRSAPGLMDGISKTMEPLFGDLFRMGANASAKVWAKKNGLDPNGPEAKAKAVDTYQHEAKHLGQAAVWTAGAFGLNITFQSISEYIWTPKGGRTPLKVMLGSKGIGSTITSAALVGLRGFGPAVAENWDDWTSQHIFMPVTRKVSHLLGVPDEAIKTFEKKEDEDDKHWDNVIARAKEKKALEAKPAAVVSNVTDHAVQQSAASLSA